MPIGRFATITRLSVRMLRYYDERGLLPPAYVDLSSGYRYYRVEQAPLAEVIRLMRAFDMPLNEIAEVLGSVGSCDLPGLLDRHRSRINEEIAEKRRSLAYLDELIAHVEGGGDFPSGDVDFAELVPQQIISRREHRSLDDVGVYTGETIGQLYRWTITASIAPIGPPFAIYHLPAGGDGFDVEVGLPVACASDPDAPLDGRELSGGTAGVLTHRGPYESLGAAYRMLARSLQEQRRLPSGPPREIYLTSPTSGLQPGDYVTQIVWPVAGRLEE